MRIYKQGEKYRLDFTWKGGRVRLTGYTDKRATQRLADNIEILAACTESGTKPDLELSAWIESLPNSLKKRLASKGLINNHRLEASKSLLDQLSDYKVSMEAKKRNSRHIRQEISKIKRSIKECNFITHSDIDPERLQNWLSGLMDDTPTSRGISPRTANTYLVALKAFCNWFIPNRATFNPLQNMQKFNEHVDIRRTRRALSTIEIQKLIETTNNSDIYKGMAGVDRAMLYLVAINTGLRWSELRSLKRNSFDLESATPTVTVEAAYSKHRKKDILPLRDDIAVIIKDYFASSLALPTVKAFPTLPKKDVGAELIKHDLELANIPYIDDFGKVADFHALRHSYISALASSGVHPSTAQALARHSTITLTMDRYTHSLIDSQKSAIESLPQLRSIEANQHRQTGTDINIESYQNDEKVSAKFVPNCAESDNILADLYGQSGEGCTEVQNSDNPIKIASNPEVKGFSNLVGRERFELSKTMSTDLQSVPFGHSGISPLSFKRIISIRV